MQPPGQAGSQLTDAKLIWEKMKVLEVLSEFSPECAATDWHVFRAPVPRVSA